MIKIGDFTYKKDSLFSIDHNKKIPQTFYKYYSLSENSVDAITTPYIYAAHPYQLNDPFDCSRHIIDFDIKTAEDIKGKMEKVIDFNTGDKKDVKEYASWAFDSIEFRKLGIFSMTESFNNELMWAHYARKDGFCVELDINQFEFRCAGPYPINYQERIDKVKIEEIGMTLAIAIQCNVKRDIWSYEKEWRLTIASKKNERMKTFGPMADEINRGDEHDRKFKYPISAIKRIIFRRDFFEAEEFPIIDKDGDEVFIIKDARKRRLLDFIIKNKIDVYVQYTRLYGEYNLRNIDVDRIRCTKYKIKELYVDIPF